MVGNLLLDVVAVQQLRDSDFSYGSDPDGGIMNVFRVNFEMMYTDMKPSDNSRLR